VVPWALGWGDPVRERAEARPEPQSPASCPTCSRLGDREFGFQTGGRPEDDKHLPPAVNELKLVRDYQRGGSRELHLLQCPRCKTYYVYRTDYEFLAGGSEDEQTLIRLSPEEAPRYLKATLGQVRSWTYEP
jgi:hypothetical protein